ncbi:ATP synthase subunit I [Paraglaciecola aquimarina]|uniref:ATP synthase subunit I n=1 Tax=Paraglaciecola aquimarina TaxID=1235557 RepID=A0ABU3STK9_9ALTE|nr:ATP synthase subunit I [Paraglaciecola aquimarina]MDU0353345.1 ATP synthase subunit I [Paraglaciecola aquimarina]
MALIVSFIYFIFFGKYQAISAVYGGLICVLPGMVFAFLVFRYAGASKNKLVVRSFSKGSKLKFLFTIVMFILIYKWQHLQPIALLVTYAVTLMAQWPIIIFLNRVSR